VTARDQHLPPTELAGRVLDASRAARAPGRFAPPPPDITAAEAFSRAADSLGGLLCALDDAAWDRPVLRDLTVQELIGHLLGVEGDLHRALTGTADVAALNHVGTTQPSAMAQSGRLPADTYRDWREAVDVTLDIVTSVTPSARRLGLHGLRLPLAHLLVARAFEFWAHENDIRRVTEQPPSVPDPSTLALMTGLAVEMLPRAMAAQEPSERTVALHLVLTGAGGGTWDVDVPSVMGATPGAASPALMIVTDAVDFCRLAANRVRAEDVDAYISGDQDRALRVLAAATTLALD
jgi:hypothetical protein